MSECRVSPVWPITRRMGNGWILVEEFLGGPDDADHHCLELLLKTGRPHRVVPWNELED